jgi:hypothetical protein
VKKKRTPRKKGLYTPNTSLLEHSLQACLFWMKRSPRAHITPHELSLETCIIQVQFLMHKRKDEDVRLSWMPGDLSTAMVIDRVLVCLPNDNFHIFQAVDIF